ncbi:MAG: DUF4105 domain-containing protein [Paludibacter sp.]|jgi:hypothetical protein|nr:DUF4105 domain-containing protein [Paludibacter sp.]
MKVFIHLIVALFFILSPFRTVAQTLSYGDSVVVSLLTCEPGDQVYERFGHTALRIRDANGRDMTYNYGIFNFNTEGFYLKFLRGHTDYLLGIYPTEYFLEDYRQRQSNVWEQVLNLTEVEKRRLIDLLNENYLPANRTYRYNFVFDNCATRPKVMIQNTLDGVLSYESAYYADTYRQLIHHYISDDAWLSLGIHLIFGTHSDRTVNQGGAAFLPELLRNDLQQARIVKNAADRNPRMLVTDTHLLEGPFAKQVISTPWWIHPLTIAVLWLVWGIVLTFSKNKRSKQSKSFDTILYVITALAGILIFMLSFLSEHPMVGGNWNLLWLNPLNLLPAVFIWTHKARRFLLFYHAIYLLMILMAGCILALQVQVVPIAAFPVILLLILRTSRRLKCLIKNHVEYSSGRWKWKN